MGHGLCGLSVSTFVGLFGYLYYDFSFLPYAKSHSILLPYPFQTPLHRSIALLGLKIGTFFFLVWITFLTYYYFCNSSHILWNKKYSYVPNERTDSSGFVEGPHRHSLGMESLKLYLPLSFFATNQVPQKQSTSSITQSSQHLYSPS